MTRRCTAGKMQHTATQTGASVSITKTFRFPDELDQRLRRAAQHLVRKPNAIMVNALQEYLDRLERRDLQSEARRQSLLVSRGRKRDAFWERAADRTGWK